MWIIVSGNLLGVNVWGANILDGSCPGDNCPYWEFPGEQLSRGKLSRGNGLRTTFLNQYIFAFYRSIFRNHFITNFAFNADLGMINDSTIVQGGTCYDKTSTVK